MKKFLLAMVLLPFMALAATEKVGDITWSYSSSGSEATVTGADPCAGSIEIPSTLGGLSVTSIGDNAFRNCSGLTSVTIPEGVTRIGDYMFGGCSSLTAVTIPSSVTYIGEDAFYNCNKLSRVNINDLAAWCKIEFFGAYDNPLHDAKHLYLNGKEVTDLTIPEGVTYIRRDTFSGCSAFTSLTIPESVTWIDMFAFSSCSGLTSVTISSGVKEIAVDAFTYCSGLTSILVDENNPNYSSIDGLLCCKDQYYDGVLLHSGINGEVVIPDCITTIGRCSFEGRLGLTSVTIPSSVKDINDYAFLGCSGLETIYVDSGDTERIKGLLRDSGFDVDSVRFVERRVIVVSEDLQTTNSFNKLSAAFDSQLLQEPGVTNRIVLMQDIVEEDITNHVGSAAILDLNGHSIVGIVGAERYNETSLKLANESVLIVDDYSSTGEGRIESEFLSIVNTGTFIMNGGTIFDSCGGGVDEGIVNRGVLIFNGGLIHGIEDIDGAILQEQSESGHDVRFEMNGGRIECFLGERYGIGILSGDFIVNGGEIDTAPAYPYNVSSRIYIDTTGSVEIKGGRILGPHGLVCAKGSSNGMLLRGGAVIEKLFCASKCTIEDAWIMDATLDDAEDIRVLGGKFGVWAETKVIEEWIVGNRGLSYNLDSSTNVEYPYAIVDYVPQTGAAIIVSNDGVTTNGFVSLAAALESSLLRQKGVTNRIILCKDAHRISWTNRQDSAAVLDLDGFAVVGDMWNSEIYGEDFIATFCNFGTLIIDDSSALKGGVITVSPDRHCNLGVENSGILVINNGVIQDDLSLHNWIYDGGIINRGEFVLNNGVIQGVQGYDGAIRQEKSLLGIDPCFEMNGGVISGFLGAVCGINVHEGLFVLNGGEIQTTCEFDSVGIDTLGLVEVNGGMILGEGGLIGLTSGGNFRVNGDAVVEYLACMGADCEITGGYLKDATIVDGEINISGGCLGAWSKDGLKPEWIADGCLLVDNTDSATKDEYPYAVVPYVSIEALTIDWGLSSFVYDGQQKEPVVTVKDRGTTLTKGKHYLVEYKDNVNVGTAKAIVKGIDLYVGEVTNEFTIVKGTIPPGDDPDPVDPSVGPVDPDDPAQREDPTIPFSSFDYVGMYDGASHTINTNALKAAYEAALGAVAVGYATSSNGTYQSAAFAFKDAVVTSFWYKVSSANYADVVKPCKVAITNRPVTVTSGTKLDFVYDGKPHAYTNLTVTAGSFVAGEGIATSNWATVTAVADGDVANSFDYAPLAGTKLSNYDLTIVTGKIAVVQGVLPLGDDPDPVDPSVGPVDPDDPAQREDPTIPFSSFDYVGMYDGASHTINTNALKQAYEAALGAVTVGYATSSNGTYQSAAFAFKDVVVTSFWYKVSSANYADVVKPCKVAITNRLVTLTSGTEAWEYDGNAHSNTTITIGGAGFVEGEGVKTFGFATIVDLGTVANSFSYEFLPGTARDNYSVACVYGSLSISHAVTVLVGSGAKMLGEDDPVSLATNFTVVAGDPMVASELRGYCRRTPGEAAGEYAVNFVCTHLPQGLKVPLTVVPGVFTIHGADLPPYPVLPAGQVALVLSCDERIGKVKGTGIYASGKKVSISATANSGYVFAGWYEDLGFSRPAVFGSGKSAKDYRTASQSVVVTSNTSLFARFVAKTTVDDPIVWLRYAGTGYTGHDAGYLADEDTWYQGVLLPTNGCKIAFGSASLPKVTVKGLPTGVKFDAVSQCFTGVPTKAGAFNVEVTVKNASGATAVLRRKVTVEPLPAAWVIGTFNGGSTNGMVQLTVAKTGKLSGKWMSGGTNWTLSAASFDAFDAEHEAYHATLIAKSGKVTFEVEVELTAAGLVGDLFEAWRNEWKEESLKTLATDLKGKTEQVGEVLLTVGSSGAVTAKLTTMGLDDKSYSASCSTVLIPTATANEYLVYIYFPLKTGKFNGWSSKVLVEFCP